MQLADHRLEVEPCRCRARLLHRCFVVSHTHTTPPKTTPDAKQLDGTPTVRASRGALVVPNLMITPNPTITHKSRNVILQPPREVHCPSPMQYSWRVCVGLVMGDLLLERRHDVDALPAGHLRPREAQLRDHGPSAHAAYRRRRPAPSTRRKTGPSTTPRRSR
jgi:hypothetical protein